MNMACDSSGRRIQTLQRHITAASKSEEWGTNGGRAKFTKNAATAAAAKVGGAADQVSALQVDSIAEQFTNDPQTAFRRYRDELFNWEARHIVEDRLQGAARDAFMHLYREHVRPFIRDDFYNCSSTHYRKLYVRNGEISVPLLREECLAHLQEFGTSVETLGKHRYSLPRPTYPPGEVLNMDDSDPRKSLTTDVNMTAIGCRHFPQESAIKWIYHSPHLREFLKVVIGCDQLFPYFSDLGLAINVMREKPRSRTALGFHFDSIDSSIRGSTSNNEQGSVQPKGVTGVIGICDAIEGGERVTFPTVSRCDVGQVAAILNDYDPLNPGSQIGESTPTVFREPTRGVLFLFDGGNVLHGVSAVRKGSRMAAVFLFKEEPPVDTAASKAGASFFFGN